MRILIVSLAMAVFSLGCAKEPYTGTSVSQTVDSSGMKITRSESRSMLPGKVLAGSESELRQITAEVMAIDPITRQIVLRTPDNKTHSIIAGEEVRNFSLIKPGDNVNIEYFATINFEVRQPSPEELRRAEAPSAVFGRAPKGSTPAGLIGVGDVAILVIEAIDKPSQTVKLSGPNGTFNVKTNHPENLDFINRGDNVVLEVAALFAAKVVPQS